MEITVNEALKLKNQIAAGVNKLQRQVNYGVSYGVSILDGEEVVTTGKEPFPEVFEKLQTLFDYSNQINTVLAGFNVSQNIPWRVRERQNAMVLVEVLEHAVLHGEPSESKTVEYPSGTGKVIRERSYKPYMTREEAQQQVKELKQKIRDLDAAIFAENQKTVSLTFTYEDVDRLVE